MLRSIEPLSDARDRIQKYRIVDTCFSDTCAIEIRGFAPGSITPDLAVIQTYCNRKRNVSKALAEMYLCYIRKHRCASLFNEDQLCSYKNNIETYYPEVEFEKKYYKCMLKHLSLLKKREADEQKNIR